MALMVSILSGVSEELRFLLVFLLFIILLWIIWRVGLRWWGRRQMRKLARELELEWKPGERGNLASSLGSIDGEYKSHAVLVSHFNERFGIFSGPMLKISMPVKNPHEFTLHVASSKGVGAIGRKLGMPVVITGDLQFDTEMLVKSRHKAFAKSALSDEVRDDVLEAWDKRGASGSLKLEDNMIRYEEPAAVLSGGARRRVKALLNASAGIKECLETQKLF